MRKSLMCLMVLVFTVALALPAAAQEGDEALAEHLGGATEFARVDERTGVTLLLDWVPNTNHLGFYVAQSLGYFDEANLEVSIQEPTDLQVETVVISGAAQFGVSYQELATYALADDAPIVSLAAIIQHNTSGFVTLHEQDPIERPADLAGMVYGGFGQPDLELAVLDRLLECDGAEPGTIEYVDVGYAEPFPLMERDRFDLAWMYYAWTGIDAELRGVELDAVMLMDYFDCLPDYYTPILIASREMVETQPDVVRAFVHATARGFAYAIEHPDEAAAMLSEAVPELDPELVLASAEWLAPQYRADAPRWGEQSADIWQGFSDFLVEHGILAEGIDADAAFTNEFLPGEVEEAVPDSEG